MDTSDPDIVFDDTGRCNHCIEATRAFMNGGIDSLQYLPGSNGVKIWQSTVRRIRSTHNYSKSPYDSLLGISGGIDSCYAAYVVKNSGLNPLLLHVDTGWNSEIATSNIYNLCKSLQLSLVTVVLNWKSIQQLQLAYLRSDIANLDVIQDHAIFSTIRRFAKKNNYNYLISGGNLASEIIFPKAWHGPAMDGISLQSIASRFGASRYLADYPLMSPQEYYLQIGLLGKVRTLRPLNLLEYNKQQAEEVLSIECNFRTYPIKHGENVFTRLFQNYILPKKYGYDKRRPHLSSLISSDCLSRKAALQALQEPIYDRITLMNDIEYFSDKLRISSGEFARICSANHKTYYKDYPNWQNYYKCVLIAKRTAKYFNPAALFNRL